jgi:hypothetical protein
MPLAVSNLSFCFGVGLTPVLFIQFLKVSDLNPKIPNLFTKHCEMIHKNRIAHSNEFFELVYRNPPVPAGKCGNGLAVCTAQSAGTISGGSIIISIKGLKLKVLN